MFDLKALTFKVAFFCKMEMCCLEGIGTVNLYAYILSSVFIPPEMKIEGVFRIELVGLSVHQIWWFPDDNS